MIYDTAITGTLRALEGAVRRAPEAQRAEVRAFGERVLARLVARTPIGQGPSARRLYQRYETEQAADSYRITNRTPYLKFVLRGRRAVRARPGGVLRFVIGGRVLFRKRVGPARANPYDRPVVAEARRTAPAVAEAIVRRMVRP